MIQADHIAQWKDETKMSRRLLIFIWIVLCASLPISGVSGASGDDIEDMMPAFDSIMRVMMDGEAQYDPLNPDFFWETIHLMAVNFTSIDSDEEVGYDEDTCELLLPALAVREMAIALFADYDGILPIPSSASYLARYDDDLNRYHFPLSDAGDSYARIDRYAFSPENFVFVVYASLVSYDEEETFLSVKFELMPNTALGDIVIRYYPYSVVSAEAVK